MRLVGSWNIWLANHKLVSLTRLYRKLCIIAENVVILPWWWSLKFMQSVLRLKITVLWDVPPCSLVGRYQCFGGACCHSQVYPEDGGSWFFWNIGTCLPKYTVLHSRRLLVAPKILQLTLLCMRVVQIWKGATISANVGFSHFWRYIIWCCVIEQTVCIYCCNVCLWG